MGIVKLLIIILLALTCLGCAKTKIDTYHAVSAGRSLTKKIISPTDTIVVLPISFDSSDLSKYENRLTAVLIKEISKKFNCEVKLYEDKENINVTINQLWSDISGRIGEELVAEISLNTGGDFIILVKIIDNGLCERGQIFLFDNNIKSSHSFISFLRIINTRTLKLTQISYEITGSYNIELLEKLIRATIQKI